MDSDERKGDWMQTYSGRAFYPLDPRPEDICLDDIVWGLAHVCRFGGHVLKFYSVLEHCYHVSLACDPADALEGLMHDASEAYLGDVVRPLKMALPEYKAIETNVERVIAEKFGLRFPWPKSIKRADNAVLQAERRDIMPPPPMPWRDHGVPIYETPIRGWSPRIAMDVWRDRYRALTDKRAVA